MAQMVLRKEFERAFMRVLKNTQNDASLTL